MKRAAIITITDYLNYGNRLQNFATQEILKSYGLDVESIANFPEREKVNEFEFRSMRIKNAMRLSPLVFIRKLGEKFSERVNRNKFQKALKAKENSFREYALRHTVETSYVVKNEIIPQGLADQYDYFVIGSDQIWNPHIRYGNSFDFARFAALNKRIALAPSFGISDIDANYQPNYRLWLSEIEHLSVREMAGAAIIKQLTGRNVPVLVDPTLLLNKDQWLQVAETNKHKPAKPYLVTYFIGKVSSKRQAILKKMAKDNDLELVQLASLEDIKRYDANPGEFIDYIHSAQLVCTDSFHAIIFSMLMRKPFVVFDREGKSSPMSSRIETLLSKFQFESRKYSELLKTNDLFRIEYSHVDAILETERTKVYEFLDSALNLNR